VSTETIYQSLYVQSRGALKRDLTSYLRTGRAVRRPSRKVGQRKNRIPNMINIAEWPAEADDRAVPGDWESSRHNTAISRWHRVCVRLGQNCGKGCRVAAPAQLVVIAHHSSGESLRLRKQVLGDLLLEPTPPTARDGLRHIDIDRDRIRSRGHSQQAGNDHLF
jgi:hypothetical protein